MRREVAHLAQRAHASTSGAASSSSVSNLSVLRRDARSVALVAGSRCGAEIGVMGFRWARPARRLRPLVVATWGNRSASSPFGQQRQCARVVGGVGEQHLERFAGQRVSTQGVLREREVEQRRVVGPALLE